MGWLKRARTRLATGLLSDPTHISLGLLCIVVAISLFGYARGNVPALAILPPYLFYGWAAGLMLAGIGKVAGPFLFMVKKHEDDARAILLASSILASACWGTIGIAFLFLGPGATLGVLQALALALGAGGRAWAIWRNTQTVENHVDRSPTP